MPPALCAHCLGDGELLSAHCLSDRESYPRPVVAPASRRLSYPRPRRCSAGVPPAVLRASRPQTSCRNKNLLWSGTTTIPERWSVVLSADGIPSRGATLATSPGRKSGVSRNHQNRVPRDGTTPQNWNVERRGVSARSTIRAPHHYREFAGCGRSSSSCVLTATLSLRMPSRILSGSTAEKFNRSCRFASSRWPLGA